MGNLSLLRLFVTILFSTRTIITARMDRIRILWTTGRTGPWESMALVKNVCGSRLDLSDSAVLIKIPCGARRCYELVRIPSQVGLIGTPVEVGCWSEMSF